MDPEIILISPFKRGGYEALKETGVPLIPHLGYKELTPLGQAEWIRLIGLLTGCEEEANQCFDEIERKYNALYFRSISSKHWFASSSQPVSNPINLIHSACPSGVSSL